MQALGKEKEEGREAGSSEKGTRWGRPVLGQSHLAPALSRGTVVVSLGLQQEAQTGEDALGWFSASWGCCRGRGVGNSASSKATEVKGGSVQERSKGRCRAAYKIGQDTSLPLSYLEEGEERS